MATNQTIRATKTDPIYAAIAAQHEQLRAKWQTGLTPVQREALKAAFPVCDSGLLSTGDNVLIQMKRPRTKVGNIITVAPTQEAERWNEQVGLVVALGPLAYRSTKNIEEWWPEGPWCVVDDYVRIPKYGFDRYEAPLPGNETETAIFATVKGSNVLGVVTINPLLVKSAI